MAESIIYEQPLNERMRTLLRLEYLFNRFETTLSSHSTLKTQYAMDSLLNIMSAFERSDLKLEIIKELDRLVSNLAVLENTMGVDKQKLNILLAKLEQVLGDLHAHKCNISQSLRDNDLLHNIRQRSSILGGGSFNVDIPAYHFWLQCTSGESQQEQLQEWSRQLATARAGVEIALTLVRNSIGFHPIIAEAGFYQKILDSKLVNQLIRIKLTKSSAYYPEISGGKHRFTVHFMCLDNKQHAKQINENVPFLLSCCCM